MKATTASITKGFVLVLSLLCACIVTETIAQTCGGGNVGDGVCPGSLCCSEWGWCGTSPDHCRNTPAPPSPQITPAPAPPTVPVNPAQDDSRMVAYLGNWQSCPTAAQLAQYTHIVIAFAVSYTWNPTKNVCSQTCEIATPPICNNAGNPTLISDMHAAGKKVILSFGGAGMGGSWAGDVNDCWEYCFGRESQVVDRLVDIVNELNLDGVDIDYEYFYEDNQNGSGFSKGSQAVNFLTQVTSGLRTKLPVGSIVTHAPMDSDLVQGSAYYDLLRGLSSSLDFLMPQYYNGVTRPVSDGLTGTGFAPMSALEHYTQLVDDLFDGDATRLIFGLCINDCSGTGSNANANQAAIVMHDLNQHYSCNGGAFFWVAQHDTGGSWSATVNLAVQQNAGCSGQNPVTSVPTIAVAPTLAPTDVPTSKPIAATPSPTTNTDSPTMKPQTASPTTSISGSQERCCPSGFTGLRAFDSCAKYYHCVEGAVVGDPIACPASLLFDQSLGQCNWADQVTVCTIDPICGGSGSTGSPTNAPTASTFAPTKPPSPAVVTSTPTSTPPVSSNRCCPSGFTGLRGFNGCSQYYHCVTGVVASDPIDCGSGLLFDEGLQICNWPDQVTNCQVDSCSSL